MIARALKALIPKSFTGQLVLLIVASLILTQAILVLMFALERRHTVEAWIRTEITNRIADTAERLHTEDPERHELVLRALSSRRLQFRLGPPRFEVPAGQNPVLQKNTLVEALEARGLTPVSVETGRSLRRPHRRDGRPPPDKDGMPGPHRGPMHAFATIDLGGGLVFTAHWRHWVGIPPWNRGVLTTTLVSVLVLIGVVVLAARRISEPLRDLTQSADRAGATGLLGRVQTPPVPERGPDDMRRTIRAYNRMGERLSNLLDHQRRMLAAVGHDLRTPITALRLRAEFVTDEDNRTKMIRILDEMQSMTDGILSLVREDIEEEAPVPTDLADLVDSIVGDFQDLGSDVRITISEPAVAVCRPVALARALRNLIENAVRYGERARVRLSADERTATILIDDDGPGLSREDLETVFEPFARLETSRSRETGGLGLGLTIARSLIDLHDGSLILETRPEGGLRAAVTLPLKR